MDEIQAPPQAAPQTNMYPRLVIKNNDNPSKLLAFPFFGFLIRAILVIPVNLVNFCYSLWYLILLIVVPFPILFTGKYPEYIYRYILGYMRYSTKVRLYLSGLTDTYPGFGLDTKGLFELDFPKPQTPSRLLGAPLLGFLIRIILIIPYAIFETVLMYGAQWAVFFSWFAVLFKGKYPESLYEFTYDSIRVMNAASMYTSYLSDTYPSFHISMNHKKIKILLLVLGTITTLTAFSSDTTNKSQDDFDNYNTFPENTQYTPES